MHLHGATCVESRRPAGCPTPGTRGAAHQQQGGGDGRAHRGTRRSGAGMAIHRSLIRPSHCERLRFPAARHDTLMVTVSMYTVSDGCCPVRPALGSCTGILAIVFTTSRPFTIRPKIV